MEYLIDAADGKILGAEVPIEFSQLPEPVRAAAHKYFGTTTGLIAMKGVEFGQTHYEIEGTRKGKRVEVTFDPSGKQEKRTTVASFCERRTLGGGCRLPQYARAGKE